jgi:hypothetical protein
MWDWKLDISDQDKKKIKIEFNILLKVWYKLPKIKIWWKYNSKLELQLMVVY